MAASCDIAAPTLTLFSSLDKFKAIALPVLESDLTLNTLALSALHEARPDARGLVMGLLSCTSCQAPHQNVLVSPGFRGVGCQLYIAPPSACHAAAESIAKQLPNLPCSTISSAAAGMDLLLPLCGWQPKHLMNVMLYKPNGDSSTEMAVHAINTTTAPAVPVLQEQGSSAAAVRTTVSTAASKLSTAIKSVQLRTCCADSPSDEQLALDCAGEFLAEVFHLPSAPPAEQLAAMVIPRLQQGLYYALETAAGVPVCMASHFPTSCQSTRITMLWAPRDCRGRGYGRQTVSQLCSVLVGQGFKHICLMADQDQPAVNALYQAVGFQTVGKMVMAEKPAEAADNTLVSVHEN